MIFHYPCEPLTSQHLSLVDLSLMHQRISIESSHVACRQDSKTLRHAALQTTGTGASKRKLNVFPRCILVSRPNSNNTRPRSPWH